MGVFQWSLQLQRHTIEPTWHQCHCPHQAGKKRLSWQFQGKDGWNAGISIEHYHYQRVVPKCSCLLMILDTTEFKHQHLTQPSVTAEDQVLHGVQYLTSALKGMPTSSINFQMSALRSLRDIINTWSGVQIPALPAAQPEYNSDQPATTAPTYDLLPSALDMDK